MTFYRHRVLGIGAGGEQWVTTLHSQSAVSLATAHTAFTTCVRNFWINAYAALVTPDQKMVGQITDQLDPVTGKNVAQTASEVTDLGTDDTGVPLSPRSAVVVALKTGLPTRRGRGRMFWIAPTSLSIDAGGALSAAAAAVIGDEFQTQLTTMKATTVPIVFHRPHLDPDTGLHVDGAGTPVLQIKINETLGTQRRRTNKTPQVSYLTTI